MTVSSGDVWLRDPEPHEQKGRGDAKICLVVGNGKTKFKGTVNSAKDTTDVLQGTPSRRPVNPDCARAARSGSTGLLDPDAAGRNCRSDLLTRGARAPRAPRAD